MPHQMEEMTDVQKLRDALHVATMLMLGDAQRARETARSFYENGTAYLGVAKWYQPAPKDNVVSIERV